MIRSAVSSACFYPLETEKELLLLAENGIMDIEFWVNSFDEVEERSPYFEEIRKIVKKYALNIVSMHPFTSCETQYLMSDYSRRKDWLLDVYKRHFEVFCELSNNNNKIFVIHGARADFRVENELYFERYVELMELGRSFGIKVTQENIALAKSGSPAFIQEMSNYLKDDVYFTLDLKQIRRYNRVKKTNHNYKDYFIDGKTVHVHVSDGDERYNCLNIDNGDFDFNSFFEFLRAKKYYGMAVLELYSEDFNNIIDLKEGFERLNKYIAV